MALQLSILMHRKHPGYEVKANISFKMRTKLSQDELQDKLNLMRGKLEQSIPGSYKVKYAVNREELILKSQAKNASNGQRAMQKLEQFIKDAATTLKLK